MTKTQDIGEELTQLGFSLDVSAPRGEAEDNWQCVAYECTLKLDGKAIWNGAYRLGIRHVNLNALPENLWAMRISGDEENMLYAWRNNPHATFKDKALQAKVAAKVAAFQKVKPALADVLRSLLSEGEAFFNAESFESWATKLGYDPDSRKAEATWKACDETGRALARGIPQDTLTKICELLADY
jgi:hypothetical protein